MPRGGFLHATNDAVGVRAVGTTQLFDLLRHRWNRMLPQQFQQRQKQPDHFRLFAPGEDLLKLLSAAGVVDRVENIVGVKRDRRVVNPDMLNLTAFARLFEYAIERVEQVPDVEIVQLDLVLRQRRDDG